MEVVSSNATNARIGAGQARLVASSNAAIWVETYLKNEYGEPWSFRERVYQIEPMTLDHPKVSCKKGTQGGWTLAFMARMLYGMIYGQIRRGCIYLFPTDVKVSEFSQRRWTGLIDHNPYPIGRHVHKTNNVHTKRVGTANLMMVGGQLTHNVKGLEKESAALRSDPADVVVFEEKDLIPEYSVGKARGRLGASDLGWEWSLSNPTVPGYGIDADWQASDQRHWMVRCESCNSWWCLEIEFPAILRRHADGRVTRSCLKCGKELDIRKGQWVAKFPQRSKDHVGYWWSQLNSLSPACSPATILSEHENPPEGNVGDFQRLRLGLAYLDAQYGLTAADVLLCCGREPALSSSTYATAMGVDVGKKLHVVIGLRLTNDAYRVLTCLLVDSWDELKNVARAFNVELSSLDNEPEIHKAREYQSSGQGRIWLSDYTESVLPASYNLETGVIKCNRTEWLDTTHFYVTTPGRLILPSVNENVKTFADQCAAMAKVVIKDSLTGEQKSFYISKGPDHFRHAFLNFLLAARQQTPVEYRRTHTPTNAPRRSGFDLYEGRG